MDNGIILRASNNWTELQKVKNCSKTLSTPLVSKDKPKTTPLVSQDKPKTTPLVSKDKPKTKKTAPVKKVRLVIECNNMPKFE